MKAKKGPNSGPKSSKSRPGTLGKFRPKMAKIQAHKTKFESKKGPNSDPKSSKSRPGTLGKFKPRRGKTQAPRFFRKRVSSPRRPKAEIDNTRPGTPVSCATTRVFENLWR